MSNQISFFIPGQPIPKGRPKFFNRGNYVGVYTPVKTKDYQNHIIDHSLKYKPHGLIKCAIIMNLDFILPRPKSLPKKFIHHIKRPDLDNYIKCVLDALNKVFYQDDSQIVQLNATKQYGESVGVHIRIKPIPSVI